MLVDKKGFKKGNNNEVYCNIYIINIIICYIM